MKKLLCMILALLIIACSLPAIITSYADDSVNLLADASNSNGTVTWTDRIDPKNGEGLIDNLAESVYDGYSWAFGLGYGDVVGDKYEYVNIKAANLQVGASYNFSYIYQRDFIFAIDSIANTSGGNADFTTPVTTNVPATDKERSYKVSTTFTVPSNGDYTIKLKINRDMRTGDCKWQYVTLSDLVLTKVETTNYLENATKTNGLVSWTENIDARTTLNNVNYIDNKSFSVNGGFSWTFGMGNPSLGLPTTANPAYVYVKANGLTANTRYDFSFIYQKDFIFVLDSIKDGNNNVLQLETAAQDVAISGGDRAHQVKTTFVAPTDGDYIITLMTNRDMRPAVCNWDVVVLSDLVLIKSLTAAKVAAEVLVSGNGDATVSDTMPTVGSQVTYTATPWAEEEFLGWYKGEEKISDSLTYSFAVTEKVTLTAKFISQSLNVLAGKKATDWTGYEHAKIEDSTESKNGGKAYLVKKAMYQSIYTKVTLKANTKYDLSFNWKAVQNSVCPVFPKEIKVYEVSAADIEDRETNWKDGGNFSPANVTDLEQGSNYADAEIAKTYQWQNISTSFTTTGETEYNLVIHFTISGNANEQAINLSDFVLKEKNSPVNPPVNPDPPAEPEIPELSEKTAADWAQWNYSEMSDSTESRKGGKAYYVDKAMYQSVATKIVLKPGTNYDFSFEWKAVANAKGNAYPSKVGIYSAKSGTIPPAKTLYNNTEAESPYPENGYQNLAKNITYPDVSTADLTAWNTLSGQFTTGEDTEYYLTIYFARTGASGPEGNDNQKIYLSDFALEEKDPVVTPPVDPNPPAEPEIPELSEKDAANWTGYEWSKIENSNVSRNGGKGYLVQKAMFQSIYTELKLKPKTQYKLSFEWKAVQNAKGSAFPHELMVTEKDAIDIKNPANWNSSLFEAGIYDLEVGGSFNDQALANKCEWQTVTVSFSTTDEKYYNLALYFHIDLSAGAEPNEQQVNISDFVLEEVGQIGGDEIEEDSYNLASKYSHTTGEVTWSENADPHYYDRLSDIEGGYAWAFGIGETDFETKPAYVYIKTQDLEAGNKYEFSYIYQKDFLILFDSIDQDVVITKTMDTKLLEGDRAHRITVHFTTTKAGDHTITLKMGKGMNNENCGWSNTVLSDLKLYDITNRVYGSVKSELGGTVTGFDGAYCIKGDKIVLTATPRSGNTFKGWYDAAGKLVSSNAVYEFIAENEFDYLAVFTGSNLPNSEWLAAHGMDGTFENGLMDGWKAEDRDNGDDTSWAVFERSADMPYNGEYSLKIRARYRTSFFRFNDLKKSTNYLLSFYVNDPALYDPQEDEADEEFNEEALIRWFSITSGNVTLYSESGSHDSPAIKGGSGWYKVNIYFNTGDYTTVDWNLFYTNKDKNEKEFIYMDDISLTEYTSNLFSNGNFASGAAPWRGEYTVSGGVANVTAGNSVYQNAELGTQALYTVSFKAKGKGVAGASQITTNPFDVTNHITSNATANINSTDWKQYSYPVFTGINPATAIYFKSTDGTLLIDDVTVTKSNDRSGAIVEKIDFESDRNALHTQSDAFEIYNGKSGDANVHSGTKSLRFNSAKANKAVSYILEDAFASFQVVPKLNYRLTIYYKTSKGNSIYLAPEFLPDEEVETIYTAETNGWTKVDFMFNKLTASYVKVIVGNVLGKTNADFYIDDITLTVAPPMVMETNSIKKYCEWPLNVLNNEGFEKQITAKDWNKLPNTATVRTDNGANGKNYLRANGGTHYVLPVQLEATDNYYLSVSSRFGANSSGYIAIASDPQGTKLYNDVNGNPASKITVDSAHWNRDSFLFSTSETGMIYLVIHTDKGYIDLDDIHIYKRQYGWEIDPNDHTEFVPYNYDNPDPSTIVYNGGDPTFGGLVDPEESY